MKVNVLKNGELRDPIDLYYWNRQPATIYVHDQHKELTMITYLHGYNSFNKPEFTLMQQVENNL